MSAAVVSGCVLVCVAGAGCMSIAEDTGSWEPASQVTGTLAPELGPPLPPSSRSRADVLRVVTWNVHFGKDPEALASNLLGAIDTAIADVVIVQEIEAYPDEPTSRTRRLAEALGMTWVYAPARIEHDGTHGLAVLSRLPLEDIEIRRLPYVEQPIRSRARIALAANVVVGDRRVRVVNVHLDVRLGAADRIQQLHPAVRSVRDDGEPLDPMIVGGDFNTNPWVWLQATVPLTGTEAILGMKQAVVVDDYLAGLELVGAVSPDAATIRVPAYEIRADNLYTRAIPIVDAGVARVDGSDHWPVWFDVEL